MVISPTVSSVVQDCVRATVGVAVSDPLANHALTLMTAGTWLAVSDSYISDAGMNPDPSVSSGSPLSQTQWDTSTKLSNGQGSVMAAYSGGGYNTANQSLYINGGGHTDYHGNEWYRFDVVDMLWKFVTWPSDGTYDSDGVNDDGTAESAHTYGSIAFSDDDGVFFRGGDFAGDSAGSGLYWEFHPSNTTWTALPTSGITGSANSAVYDPASGTFICFSTNGIYSRPANDNTGAWTSRYSDIYTDGAYKNYFNRHGAIDTTNGRILFIGNGTTRTSVINVANLASVSRSDGQTWTGDTAILSTNAPGLAYDPVNDDFVAWSGGETVYILDVDALTCTAVSPAGSNAVTPTAAAGNGTFGRWQYVGQWGGKSCFIGVNAIDQSVYFYKRA